jgi:polyribonucleotide nucleotidyltransferase
MSSLRNSICVLNPLQALEFEKEANNVSSFKVPSKARARILGRAGATIQGIKNETDTQIDMEKDAGEMMEVTVRGSKKGIASAKTAILAICSELADEAEEVIVIDQKLHRTIIGSGGQGLRDLILRCGGPTESRAQAALVRL